MSENVKIPTNELSHLLSTVRKVHLIDVVTTTSDPSFSTGSLESVNDFLDHGWILIHTQQYATNIHDTTIQGITFTMVWDRTNPPYFPEVEGQRHTAVDDPF